MKIYPPPEGFTAAEMRNGQWSLLADVRCTNPECRKEYSLAAAGGIGGPCPRCGSQCL